MAKGKYHDWITEEGLSQISQWAESGLTDKQIASNIGITEGTLNEWKNRFPVLSESLKKSKAVADQEVENALYKSACGYYVDEDTLERSWNAKTRCYDLNITKRVRKWVQPNVTAQIFWLKNRQPEQWRDKVIQENVNDDRTIGVCIIPNQLPSPPPADITDREGIIKYYEEQIQTDDDLLEQYGN